MMAYAGLGAELAGGIAGFVLLGYWLDWYFGIGPTGVVAGGIVGCVGGMVHLIRRAYEMQRRFGRPARPNPGEKKRDQTPP